MSIIIKVLIGIIVLLFAMNAGFYLSGWLTLLFLGLRGQISLEEATYLQYLGAIHRPDLAPEAIWIEIAGVLGFGLLFVVWLALMWLMVKYQPEWLRNVSLWEKTPADKNAGQSPQGQPLQEQSVAPGQMAAPAHRRGDGMTPQAPPQRSQGRGDTNLKRTAAALAAATVLVGCNPPEAHVHHNPHPRQRYEITMTVKNAPGPFDAITGSMSYYVTNPEDCVPKSLPSGAYIRPEDYPDITWTRVGDNTYKGYVYLDLLLDEDYYGLGVCHWAMVGMDVGLTFKETSFSPGLLLNQIIKQQSSTTFFTKSNYGQTELKNFADFGAGYSNLIAQHPNDFFSVTLTAKEAFE